jgi:MFS transporter, MHS family, proline/betaine transporter
VAYLVLAVPAFLALNSGAIVGIILSMLVLAVMQTFVDSTTTTQMTELVPTRVRYTGLAITYSIGMIVGSFTPAVEESLIAVTGSELVPAYVVIAISLALLPVVSIMPRYLHRSQDDETASLLGGTPDMGVASA